MWRLWTPIWNKSTPPEERKTVEERFIGKKKERCAEAISQAKQSEWMTWERNFE